MLLFVSQIACARKSSSPGPPETPIAESVIEEVNAKQLERILQDKDYVAVFWCKCDLIMSIIG